MWRHGLLLRCKPSYLIFKDPAVTFISKTSFLNPKIYVKNTCTHKSLFPSIRSYSKSVAEVLPEISLEVKRTDSLDDDPNQVGKSKTFVLVEESGTAPEDKPVEKVMPIKNDVIDLEELSLKGVDLDQKPIVKGTDSEGLLKHIRPSSSGLETDSDDKASEKNNKAILKDTIKNSNNNLEKLSLNPNHKVVADADLDPGPLTDNNTNDSKDQARATPKDAWFSVEETPERRYEHAQHNILFEAIDTSNELTSEEWDELHKKVLPAGDIVNKENIHGSIMEKCLAHSRLSVGLSYLKYLSASAQETNIATIGKFCKLAHACSSEVNENILDIITSTYDSLRARYSTFDAVTCGSFIEGLALTKRWKEGLAILDELRLTSLPDGSAYSALIKASFDNDDPDIGWDLLSKMLGENKKPRDYVYESWLEYCRRSAAGNKAVEQRLVDKLLHFVANNDIRLTENAAISLRLWFEYDAPPKANWNAEFTTIDSGGMCQSCRQHMKLQKVSKEEFESLKSIFIEKTVVGSNIFLKSTPEELELFQKFIKETAPYDVVIDGLNVGYGLNKGKQANPAKMLRSVVEHLVGRAAKVLVLGREHMNNWTRNHMQYICENADVFLADNVSQDDPFLLYATMYSGLGTQFMSKDLMRSHKFLLGDPKLQSVFLRWQKQYQLQVSYVGYEGEVKFRRPDKYSTSAQCSENGSWHIPYNKLTDSTRHQNYMAPRQWLCLTKYLGNDRYEGDSYKFGNNRYGDTEDGMYRSGGKQTQFRRSYPTKDGSENSDDDTASSPFQKRNYVDRGFDKNRDSKFGRKSAAAERLDDFGDSEDEPSQYVKRSPRQAYSASRDLNDESPQFGKSKYVDRRSGDESSKSRSASRMDNGKDSSDEETFKLKQRLSGEKLKDEMLASQSKQAFKSNQIQKKHVREDDN